MSMVVTDASGRYQLEKVSPGRYYVAAGLVQFPTYYPGASGPTAAAIVDVPPSGALEAVDIRLVALRVSGRLVRPNSEPVTVGQGYEVRLILGNGQFQTARVANDGTFQFDNVPPGTFTLAVRSPLTAAALSIDVRDRDVTDANIVLTMIKSIQGRVVVEGGGPHPRFALNTLEPAATPGGPEIPVKVMIATERLFSLRLPEGEQQLSVARDSLPAGYTVEALRYGRLDLLKQPLRVAMSDSAELVVTLKAPRVRRARVTGRVVPYDPSLPTTVIRLDSGSFVESRTAVVRNDGSFRFTDVMPGNYTLTSNLSGTSTPNITVGETDAEDIVIALSSKAAANPEAIVGSISWIIYEAFSGNVIDRGGGAVRARDILLEERGVAPNLSLRKSIALNDRFSLTMSEEATEWRNGKTSFTFTARHADYQTSSYANFRIQSPDLAERPPSQTAIAITEVASRRWEVTRTEFLSDLAIDVTHSAMVPRGSPYWRVVILKGSNITWPSLINGRTVGN
jgi:hypothetical protein